MDYDVDPGNPLLWLALLPWIVGGGCLVALLIAIGYALGKFLK